MKQKPKTETHGTITIRLTAADKKLIETLKEITGEKTAAGALLKAADIAVNKYQELLKDHEQAILSYDRLWHISQNIADKIFQKGNLETQLIKLAIELSPIPDKSKN